MPLEFMSRRLLRVADFNLLNGLRSTLLLAPPLLVLNKSPLLFERVYVNGLALARLLEGQLLVQYLRMLEAVPLNRFDRHVTVFEVVSWLEGVCLGHALEWVACTAPNGVVFKGLLGVHNESVPEEGVGWVSLLAIGD